MDRLSTLLGGVAVVAIMAGVAIAQSTTTGTTNPAGKAKVIRNFPEMTAGDCAELNSRRGSYDSSEFSARRQYCDQHITRSRVAPDVIEPDRTMGRPGVVDNNSLAPSAGTNVDRPNARVIRPTAEVDRPDTSVSGPDTGSRVLDGSGTGGSLSGGGSSISGGSVGGGGGALSGAR